MTAEGDARDYVIDLMKDIKENEEPVFIVEKGLQEMFSAINKPVCEVSLGNTPDIKYGFHGPLARKFRIIISVNTMGLTAESETEKEKLVGLVEDKIIANKTLGDLVSSCFVTEIQREKIRQIKSQLYNSALIILTVSK